MLLKNENIDVNQTIPSGYTALILASWNGHQEIVEMLLKNKNIDVAQKSDNGSTALSVVEDSKIRDILNAHIAANNSSNQGS